MKIATVFKTMESSLFKKVVLKFVNIFKFIVLIEILMKEATVSKFLSKL